MIRKTRIQNILGKPYVLTDDGKVVIGNDIVPVSEAFDFILNKRQGDIIKPEKSYEFRNLEKNHKER